MLTIIADKANDFNAVRVDPVYQRSLISYNAFSVILYFGFGTKIMIACNYIN